MSDDRELVLLAECGEQLELSVLRSLLDAQGIHHVVQGELHSAMLGGFLGNPAIRPRILVAAADFEVARAALAALPDIGGTQPDGVKFEDALCPVHEKAVVAVCGRCGTFLCTACNALGAPPVCEDCSKVEDGESARRGQRTGDRKKVVVYALFSMFLLPVLLALLARLFP